MEINQSDSRIYEQARDEAVAAARSAARLMQTWDARTSADRVREKGDHDLVTELDEQVQDLLVAHLRRAFPDHSFLAEEGELSRPDRSDSDELRWIIDPIDGTTNFSRGVPPFAISIALAQGETVYVGVILDPTSGDLYTAVRGRGLYLNGERCHVSSVSHLKEAVVATGFPYRAIGHIDAFLEVLREFVSRCHGFRRMGSAAMDLAYVATGRFDAYYEVGLSAWDMAAGKLLVEEGGGRVLALDGGTISLFGRQVLATNGRLEAEMLPLLEPLAVSAREVEML